MPRPHQGQQSSFRSALAHPDAKVRAKFIAEVAAYYGETQHLGQTAEKFGAGRRTLERCMLDFPELATAINEIRTKLGVIQ